jgi:hypothetical protein
VCLSALQAGTDNNKAELQTEWSRLTWKAFEETVEAGRNRPSKAQLVTDNDDGDYGYD